mmetsp:Transcript_7361/g.26306  ORF Transcript_7361/g.26306 Transcript_7361/m.26306 type:complete len:216 (-) Transcript_7361:286-933(-)
MMRSCAHASAYTSRRRSTLIVAPVGLLPVGMVYSTRGFGPSAASSHVSRMRRRSAGSRPPPSVATPTSLHSIGCRQLSAPEYVGDSTSSDRPASPTSISKARDSDSCEPVETATDSLAPAAPGGACSLAMMLVRRRTRPGNPGVGEYCSASLTAASGSSSTVPSASVNEMPLKGNSAGLGSPPPRLTMPSICNSGISARIGDGRRAAATRVRYDA